jgi:hypothetical protein
MAIVRFARGMYRDWMLIAIAGNNNQVEDVRLVAKLQPSVASPYTFALEDLLFEIIDDVC